MLAHVAVVAVYKELHITEGDAAVRIVCTRRNHLVAFQHFKRELILFKGCTQKLLISLQRKYSFRLIFILKYHFRNRRPVLIGNTRKNRKGSVAGIAYHYINRVSLAAVCNALQILYHGLALFVVQVREALVRCDRLVRKEPNHHFAVLCAFVDDVDEARVHDVTDHS